MLKKIIVAVLLVSVVGAAGAALAYNAANQDDESVTVESGFLAEETVLASTRPGQGPAQTSGIETESVALGGEGEPWQAVGTISDVDDNGFNFAPDDSDTVYIELGPADYWQSQGVPIEPGQRATVTGSVNEGMIHATQIMLADGQILQMRNDSGQPLWSGGVSRGRGQNGSQGDGDQIPDPQAQVSEWVTLEGTLMSFQGGSMTIGIADGELITIQTGQPRFFADQGVTFQVGDDVTVLGYYQGDQFTAGEITQVLTGSRVMLRDPNGRPLWAGPGNGQGKGGVNH